MAANKVLDLRNKVNPKGESGFNVVLRDYIYNARLRNLDFKLNREQFRKLTSQNCHYCNIEPNKKRTVSNASKKAIKDSVYIYNGIDRINNKIGYTVKNSITCCTICNRAKSNLTYKEFMLYINRIRGVK